jgi:hypothetical protein
MLLAGVFIAGRRLTISTGDGLFLHSWLGRRHRHPWLIAVIHQFNARIRCSGMRHCAWQFDRSRDALHGQRRDDYP